MCLRRPAWWFYPERCENGHEWGPGPYCALYSKKKVVLVLYFGTTVSSLSDAAAKTSQALSASGG